MRSELFELGESTRRPGCGISNKPLLSALEALESELIGVGPSPPSDMVGFGLGEFGPPALSHAYERDVGTVPRSLGVGG